MEFTREHEEALRAAFLKGEGERFCIDEAVFQLWRYQHGEVVLIPREENGTISGTLASSAIEFDSYDFQHGGETFQKAVRRAHILSGETLIKIIKSWDVECGCPIADISREIQEIQDKCGFAPHEGFIQTFTHGDESVFMVFSDSWITQDRARQAVEMIFKNE